MKAMILFLTMFITASSFAAEFKLSSSSLKPNATIPQKYVFNGFGCSGQNVSPELQWTGAPSGTQSFAITAYDPDAPTGSGWWHWTVVNIPANVTKIEEGASSDPAKLPPGAVQGRTDFGKPGYGGPCPPPGDKPHRYIFTVYALKTPKLELDQDSSGAMVGFSVHQAALGKASLTAKYGR